ncbi:MAG: HEAT repeat domain-containing protein [Candidatus Thorarchaeota archaeon]
MTDEAKNLLMRLKKEKKVQKQIELINALKDYNQEEMVNHVLLVHLQRKDHDSLRLEILSALNYNFEGIVQPLINILSDPSEPIAIKEKAINLLGQSRNKKALKAIIKAYKKSKEPAILDNLVQALTYFQDKNAIKILIKALKKEELQLAILTGLARNNATVYSSKDLIKELLKFEKTDHFESIHFDKILDNLLFKFEISSIEELRRAFNENKLDVKIALFTKELKSNKSLLEKVDAK